MTVVTFSIIFYIGFYEVDNILRYIGGGKSTINKIATSDGRCFHKGTNDMDCLLRMSCLENREGKSMCLSKIKSLISQQNSKGCML